MRSTSEIKAEIKSKLESAFNKGGMSPKIETTHWKLSEQDDEHSRKRVKSDSDNGLVYIGRLVKEYSPKMAGLQTTKEPYLIMIYVNSSHKGDELIDAYYDIARNCLSTFTELAADFVGETSAGSGVYLAWIKVYIDLSILH